MDTRPSRKPAEPGALFFAFFVVGLLAVPAGMTLLVMADGDGGLRIAGASALLLGIVLVGSYLTKRLVAEAYVDPLAFEPPWSKLGRGAGPPRLPAPGKPAAPESNAFAINALVDFSAGAHIRKTKPPDSNAPASAQKDPAWVEALFDRMSPQQFDAMCELLFTQGGFETRSQSHGAGGGTTLWLYSRNSLQGKDIPASVAVCKQWPGQPVGVRELHPLLAIMAGRQLKRGTYATASCYTDNAISFAKSSGINLLDRTALLGLFARRTPEQQEALLALMRDKR